MSFRSRCFYPRLCLARGVLIAFALSAWCASSFAEDSSASIHYEPASRIFRIDAGRSSYIFGVNEKDELQSIYWGRKLAASDQFRAAHTLTPRASFTASVNITPQEFTGWGGGLYNAPDLKITFPDGNRDLELRYVSHSIEGPELKVVMKDILREVYVTLAYRADEETGILERSATVENKTGKPFMIEEASSGTWNLPPASDYQLRYLTGEWAGEWNLHEQAMQPGKTILESRRGSTVPEQPVVCDRAREVCRRR